jgi:glutamate-ammonia-ligase adenylyltransferase
MFTSRIGASLEKASGSVSLSETNLKYMVRLCGASEFFGEMVAANPTLVAALDEESGATRDYRAVLRKSIDAEKTFSGELSALRRTWSQLLLEIGNRDINGTITRAESNRLQTELAKASINVAYLIARREMARKYGNLAAGPRLAILGLGRLASEGVDYGSDLDLILIYDSQVASPLASSTPDEAYARLGELMVAALSSITRTGHLYHVDLRLRPHGSDGPLVSSSQTFLEYLQGGAAVWEWLAYVKLRAVAGDLELGRDLENTARKIIHDGASRISSDELQKETSRVRARLEQEQPRSRRRGLLDIKYGAGGMLDVYFATRYLQLRHSVPDEGDDRSTLLTLERLREKDFLNSSDYEALRGGYALLRAVDHERRLLLGRSARLPSPEHPAMRDIAKRLGHESAESLLEQLQSAMEAIRASYSSVLDSGEAAELS